MEVDQGGSFFIGSMRFIMASLQDLNSSAAFNQWSKLPRVVQSSKAFLSLSSTLSLPHRTWKETTERSPVLATEKKEITSRSWANCICAFSGLKQELWIHTVLERHTSHTKLVTSPTVKSIYSETFVIWPPWDQEKLAGIERSMPTCGQPLGLDSVANLHRLN